MRDSAQPRALDQSSGTLWTRLGDYGGLILSLLTLGALSVYSLPFCIACEYPNPWGHVEVWQELPVTIWLAVAPFLAGLLALRNGWLVPICVIFALVITQPLGGVAWWSLRDNEGPIIVVLGLPVTSACFGLGYLVRLIAIASRRPFD